MIQKIIGFSGKKGSGKDTLAEFLYNNSFELFGVEASLYSFAGPFKDICVSFFGLNKNQVYGTEDDKNTLTKYKWENLPHYNEDKMKTGYMTAREFLQEFGTGIARKMFPNIHIDACFSNIRKNKFALNFITDVRFKNEVEEIQKHHGVVVRLTREVYSDSHISEIELDNNQNIFDIVLDNNKLNKQEQSILLVKKLKQIGWIK